MQQRTQSTAPLLADEDISKKVLQQQINDPTRQNNAKFGALQLIRISDKASQAKLRRQKQGGSQDQGEGVKDLKENEDAEQQQPVGAPDDEEAQAQEAAKKQNDKLFHDQLGKHLYESYVNLLMGQDNYSSYQQDIERYFCQMHPNRQTFLSEMDCHPGDIVLSFPNPDFKKFRSRNKTNNTITHAKKEEYFKKSILLMDAQSTKDLEEFEITRNAFYECFERLDNYYTKKQLEQINLQERKLEEIQEQIRKKKIKKDVADFLLSMDNPTSPKKILADLRSREHERKIVYGGGYLHMTVEEQGEEDEEDDSDDDDGGGGGSSDNEEDGSGDGSKEEDKEDGKSDKQGDQKNTEEQQKEEKKNDLEQDEFGEEQNLRIELKDAGSLHNPSGTLQQKKKSKKKKKKQEEEEQEKDEEVGEQEQITDNWKRSQEPVHDFLTLFRHLIWLRLTKAGFNLRHFVSKSGRFIYTVLQSDDYNLAITAEKDKMGKALNFEFSDLLSLEPCDDNLRPYRLNTFLQTANKMASGEKVLQQDAENQTDFTPTFEYYAQAIQVLLQQINFKKITRETHTNQQNDQLFEDRHIQLIDPQKISDFNWKLYHQYLMFIKSKLDKLRKKLYYKGRNHEQGEAHELNHMVENKTYRFKKMDREEKEKRHKLREILKIQDKKKRKLALQNLADEEKLKLLKKGGAKGRGSQFNNDDDDDDDDDENDEFDENDEDDNHNNATQGQFFDNNLDLLLDDDVEDTQNTEAFGQDSTKVGIDGETGVIITQNDQRDQTSRSATQNQGRRGRHAQLLGLEKEKQLQLHQELKSFQKKEIEKQKKEEAQHANESKKQQQAGIILTSKKLQQHNAQYRSLTMMLGLRSDKALHSKIIRMQRQQLLANEYKKMFLLSLQTINYPYKGQKILKNIWDSMNIAPLEPYAEFFQTPQNISFKKRYCCDTIWKKYQITENGRISMFSAMERLKLVNSTLQKCLNLNYLIEQNLLKQVFCLTDEYELIGVSHFELFSPILNPVQLSATGNNHQGSLHRDSENISPISAQVKLLRSVPSPPMILGQQSLANNSLSPKGEGIDNAIHKVVRGKDDYGLKNLTFAQRKLQNLEFIWSFRFSIPWYVPDEAVRDYFGEKISLYFAFVGYYTRQLLPMAVLGFIAYMIQVIYNSDSLIYTATLMIFGYIKLIWSKKDDSQEDSQNQERPGFVGDFRRSLIDDNLNTQYSEENKKLMRMLFSGAVSLLLMVCYFVVVVWLFIFSEYLQKHLEIPSVLERLHPQVLIPGVLNFIWIQMIDGLYEYLSELLTDIENHQRFSDYEENYIIKRFMYSFLSYCGPLFMIAFLNEQLGISCIENDCFEHATSHFGVIFISLFTWNLKEISEDYLELLKNQNTAEREQKNQLKEQKKIADKRRKQQEQRRERHRQKTHKTIALVSQTMQNSASISPPFGKKGSPGTIANGLSGSISKGEAIHVPEMEQVDILALQHNPYKRIDEFIELESNKVSYAESMDIYGTVNDYLEMTLQYSLLSLFGVTFPLSFTIAFIWDVAEIRTDKWKLFASNQRPVPLNEKSIGSWMTVLDLCSSITTLSTSGLITYISLRYHPNNDPNSYFFPMGAFPLFLFIMISSFVMRFMMAGILGEVPQRIVNIIKRQQYILRSTLEKFRKQTDWKNEKKVKEQLRQMENIAADGENRQEEEHRAKLKQEEMMRQQLEQLEREENLKNRKTVPIYKIFGSILDIDPIMLQDDADMSFREEDSDEDDEFRDHREAQDEKQSNKKKGNKATHLMEQQLRKKKNNNEEERKITLWVDSKMINHQAYVPRPLLQRLRMLQAKFKARARKRVKQIEEYMTKGLKQNQAELKFQKRGKKLYLMGMKGQWFHAFRRTDIIISMTQLVDLLEVERKERLKLQQQDRSHLESQLSNTVPVDLLNIRAPDIMRFIAPQNPIKQIQQFIEQNRIEKLRAGIADGENDGINNDQTDGAGKEDAQQNRKVQLSVQVLQILEKASTSMDAQGSIKVDSESLRGEKWERLFESLQSIKVKKMLQEIRPEEKIVLPYYEDKLYNEMSAWRLAKENFVQQIYLQGRVLRLLYLVTVRESSFGVWVVRFKGSLRQQMLTVLQVRAQYALAHNVHTAYENVLRLINADEKARQKKHHRVVVDEVHPHISFSKVNSHLKRKKQQLQQQMSSVQTTCAAILADQSNGQQDYSAFCTLQYSLLFDEEAFAFRERHHGYYANVYTESFVCTLADMLRKRRQKAHAYTEEELVYFAHFLLSAIQQLYSHRIAHSCLTPYNLVITRQNLSYYKIIGVGNLFQVLYEQERILFSRAIDAQEALYLAPEVHALAAERNQNPIDFHPIRSDVYSIGMILLSMMTLDESAQQLRSENYSGDVRRYLQDYTISLSYKYPVSFTMVRYMLEYEKPQQRRLPRDLLKLIEKNTRTEICEERRYIDKRLYHLEKCVQRHSKFAAKAADDKPVTSHFLFTLETYNRLRMYVQTVDLAQYYEQRARFQAARERQNFKKKEDNLRDSVLEDSNSQLLAGQLSMSQSFSVSQERNSITGGDRLSPAGTSMRIAQMFILYVQALVGCGRYKEAENKLSLVDELLSEQIDALTSGNMSSGNGEDSDSDYSDSDSDGSSSSESESESESGKGKGKGKKKSKGSSLPKRSPHSNSHTATTRLTHAKRLKLVHIRLNVHFLRAYVLYLSYDKDMMGSMANQAQQLLANIHKTLRKQPDYGYATSTLNNFVRYLNTSLLLIKLLQNRYRQQEAILELREVIGMLESVLRQHTKILSCKELDALSALKKNRDFALLFLQDFTTLKAQIFASNKKHQRSAEMLEEIEKQYFRRPAIYFLNAADVQNIFVVKRLLIQNVFQAELALYREEQIEFNEQYALVKRRLFDVLGSPQSLAYVLDELERFAQLFQFDPDREEVVKYTLTVLNSIILLNNPLLDFLKGILLKMISTEVQASGADNDKNNRNQPGSEVLLVRQKLQASMCFERALHYLNSKTNSTGQGTLIKFDEINEERDDDEEEEEEEEEDSSVAEQPMARYNRDKYAMGSYLQFIKIRILENLVYLTDSVQLRGKWLDDMELLQKQRPVQPGAQVTLAQQLRVERGARILYFKGDYANAYEKLRELHDTYNIRIKQMDQMIKAFTKLKLQQEKEEAEAHLAAVAKRRAGGEVPEQQKTQAMMAEQQDYQKKFQRSSLKHRTMLARIAKKRPINLRLKQEQVNELKMCRSNIQNWMLLCLFKQQKWTHCRDLLLNILQRKDAIVSVRTMLYLSIDYRDMGLYANALTACRIITRFLHFQPNAKSAMREFHVFTALLLLEYAKAESQDLLLHDLHTHGQPIEWWFLTDEEQLAVKMKLGSAGQLRRQALDEVQQIEENFLQDEQGARFLVVEEDANQAQKQQQSNNDQQSSFQEAAFAPTTLQKLRLQFNEILATLCHTQGETGRALRCYSLTLRNPLQGEQQILAPPNVDFVLKCGEAEGQAEEVCRAVTSYRMGLLYLEMGQYVPAKRTFSALLDFLKAYVAKNRNLYRAIQRNELQQPPEFSVELFRNLRHFQHYVRCKSLEAAAYLGEFYESRELVHQLQGMLSGLEERKKRNRAGATGTHKLKHHIVTTSILMSLAVYEFNSSNFADAQELVRRAESEVRHAVRRMFRATLAAQQQRLQSKTATASLIPSRHEHEYQKQSWWQQQQQYNTQIAGDQIPQIPFAQQARKDSTPNTGTAFTSKRISLLPSQQNSPRPEHNKSKKTSPRNQNKEHQPEKAVASGDDDDDEDEDDQEEEVNSEKAKILPLKQSKSASQPQLQPKRRGVLQHLTQEGMDQQNFQRLVVEKLRHEEEERLKQQRALGLDLKTLQKQFKLREQGLSELDPAVFADDSSLYRSEAELGDAQRDALGTNELQDAVELETENYIMQFMDLQTTYLELEVLRLECEVNLPHHLVELYFRIEEVVQRVLREKSARSVYYAHVLRAHAQLCHNLIEGRRFGELKTYAVPFKQQHLQQIEENERQYQTQYNEQKAQIQMELKEIKRMLAEGYGGSMLQENIASMFSQHSDQFPKKKNSKIMSLLGQGRSNGGDGGSTDMQRDPINSLQHELDTLEEDNKHQMQRFQRLKEQLRRKHLLLDQITPASLVGECLALAKQSKLLYESLLSIQEITEADQERERAGSLKLAPKNGDTDETKPKKKEPTPNPFIALCSIIQGDCKLYFQKIFAASKSFQKAEAILKSINNNSIVHPHFVRLYIKLAKFEQQSQNMLYQDLHPELKQILARDLVLNTVKSEKSNMELVKIFDNFREMGLIKFLNKDLHKFIKLYHDSEYTNFEHVHAAPIQKQQSIPIKDSYLQTSDIQVLVDEQEKLQSQNRPGASLLEQSQTHISQEDDQKSLLSEEVTAQRIYKEVQQLKMLSFRLEKPIEYIQKFTEQNQTFALVDSVIRSTKQQLHQEAFEAADLTHSRNSSFVHLQEREPDRIMQFYETALMICKTLWPHEKDHQSTKEEEKNKQESDNKQHQHQHRNKHALYAQVENLYLEHKEGKNKDMTLLEDRIKRDHGLED